MVMKKKILKFISLWIPVILWAVMIFRFSSGTIPSASENFWLDFIVKKIGHIILFATLAVLSYRAMVGEGVGRKKAAIFAVIISFSYGISDEVHQMFTQGREARFRDTIIDGFGAGLAMYLIYKYISKLSKRAQEIISKFGIK